MFIAKATRHDQDDIKAFLEKEGWETDRTREGVALIARSGAVVGCVRLIEVEPQKVVLDDVVVAKEKRGEGLGRRLIEAAMNNRGGTLFLACHDDVLDFYAKFGFNEKSFEDLPESVQDYFKRVGDYPTTPEHHHYFLTAR
jgi:N-acetylglutamate synthase-like GNAT family acetyltransferase